MPDQLIIKDLLAECHVGVYEWERANPQKIWLDLSLAIDAAKAAAIDDVKATIDYGRLVTAVTRHVQHKPYGLLETVAEEIAALLLKEFQTAQVTVRVKKRALPGVEYAAVEIVRRNSA